MFEVGVIRNRGQGTEVPSPIITTPEGGVTSRLARRRGDGRMSSPRTARLRHRGEEVARATRCRAPPKRRTTRCSPSGSFRLAVSTEVVEPVRRTDRRLPHGRIPPRWSGCARHAAGVRRHLPWSLDPFDEISSGGRNVGLPRRHHPPSEFLTLSTVYSHLDLVALFHATSAHGIPTFRAFPSQPAVSPLGDRCSLAVRLAPTLASCRPGSPLLR